MASVSYATPPALRARHWFYLGLVIFFLAGSVQYLTKIQKTAQPERSAIQRWLPQLDDLGRRENIWEKHNFPYPPIMALLLLPLSCLGPLGAALIWFLLKAVLTVAAIAMIFSMIESRGLPFPLVAKVLAVLLSMRAIQGDLIHGNINLFILFLVAGSLFAFTQKRDAAAGMLLALAVACKVTPALFLPYFLWKRAWRTFFAAAASLPLFLFVLPSAFLSWQTNAACLASWYDNMARPFLTEGEVLYTKHTNQSLPALAERLLTRSPSFTRYEEDEYKAVEYHNLADLDPHVVDWLVRAVMIAFAGLVMWSCRTPLSERCGWRMAAEFGVVLLGMLLFSERTWKHHCVTLLVPFAVLSYLLVTRWSERGLRWYLVASLIISTLLMLATSTGLTDGHDRLGKLVQVYGGYTWSFVALLAAIFWILRTTAQDLDGTMNGA